MTTPSVVRLELGQVTLPESHPRADEGACVVHGYAIAHRDGVIVVDTGVRSGHPVIDELYSPQVVSVVDALHTAGFDERDVTAVVNTHLHFDHCGQNHMLEHAPVWVTADEVEAAKAEFYTVPEWAQLDGERQRLARDGDQVAEEVQLLHTPGHTPGHLSVLVDTAAGLELIAGQACYTCAEFEAREPEPGDMHDSSWVTAGIESLRRLASLGARTVHFSHDRDIWTRP